MKKKKIGRPKLSQKKKAKVCSISLTPEMEKSIKKIGKGSLTKGVNVIHEKFTEKSR